MKLFNRYQKHLELKLRKGISSLSASHVTKTSGRLSIDM